MEQQDTKILEEHRNILETKIDNIKSNAKYEYTWTYEDLQYIQELIERNKKLEVELSDKEYLEEVYKNLRKNWNKLVNEVLGEDYYNLGIDTYTCDNLTCEDLINKKVKVFLRR